MADIIAVDDPDDPRVAAYRDVRERDLVGRKGRFVAEGMVVLNVLFSGGARHRPLSLLVAEKRVARLADLLAHVPEGVPVYAAAQPVIDALTGFHIHRGVLAIGERAPMPTAQALIAGLPPRALVVVLSAIANHDNMGGICRNAAAFGADAVILDSDCCDPFYRKAIRVSVGAALTLLLRAGRDGRSRARPAFRQRLRDAGADAFRQGCAWRGEAGKSRCRDLRCGGAWPQAGRHRSRNGRAHRHGAGGMDSLNVATASGIVLHHLAVSSP